MEIDAAVRGSGGWIRLICTESFATAKIPKLIQGLDMGQHRNQSINGLELSSSLGEIHCCP